MGNITHHTGEGSCCVFRQSKLAAIWFDEQVLIVGESCHSGQ